MQLLKSAAFFHFYSDHLIIVHSELCHSIFIGGLMNSLIQSTSFSEGLASVNAVVQCDILNSIVLLAGNSSSEQRCGSEDPRNTNSSPDNSSRRRPLKTLVHCIVYCLTTICTNISPLTDFLLWQFQTVVLRQESCLQMCSQDFQNWHQLYLGINTIVSMIIGDSAFSV